MIKTAFIFSAFLVLISNLHLPHFASNNQHFTHQFTDKNLNHLQETANKTDPKVIQSHLDLINNQISLLEKTYKQVNDLSDTEAIGNDGTLTKCKNVSKDDQVYLKYALQNTDTDLWAVYF
jgi:hypothetical protein